MNIQRIDKCVRNVVGDKYTVSSRISKSTYSYYVNIYKGEHKVQLRFSDHEQKKHKSLKTFLIGKDVNYKSLERFVAQRVKALESVLLYKAFERIENVKSKKSSVV